MATDSTQNLHHDTMVATIKRNIEIHGYTNMHVLASETTPAFAYTIGLSDSGGQDVIVIGPYANIVLTSVKKHFTPTPETDLVRDHVYTSDSLNVAIGGVKEPLRYMFKQCIPEKFFEYALWCKNLDICKAISDAPLQLVVGDLVNRLPGEAGYQDPYNTPCLWHDSDIPDVL